MSIMHISNIIREGDVDELKDYLRYSNCLNDKWYVYAAIESKNPEMCNYVLKQIKQNSKEVYNNLCNVPDTLFFLLDSKELKEKLLLSMVKVLLTYVPKPAVKTYSSFGIKLFEKEEQKKNMIRVFEIAKCAKRFGKYECINKDICQTIYDYL